MTRGLIVVVALGALATALMATGPAELAAAAKYKQPGCKKFKKAVKKADSKAEKRRAKAKLKHCKANRRVYKMVKNSRFTGARGDGVSVDAVYCANGTVADQYDSEFRSVYRRGWRVKSAKIKKGGNDIEAILVAKIKGGTFEQAVAHKKGQWLIGIANFNQGSTFGIVERTNARKECKEL